MQNTNNSKIRVPLSVVLAYLNGTKDNVEDPQWIKRLWPQRRALMSRFAHLRDTRKASAATNTTVTLSKGVASGDTLSTSTRKNWKL
jgi:hypothetical protein